MPSTPQGDDIPDAVALLPPDAVQELTDRTRELLALSAQITKANAPDGCTDRMSTREAVSGVIQSLINVALDKRTGSAGEETLSVLEGVGLGVSCFASLPREVGDGTIMIAHRALDLCYERALLTVPPRAAQPKQ